jgi:L-lactate dehydrogenase complex protein LldF
VFIPLPTMLRNWRSRSWRAGYEPKGATLAISIWAFFAARPALYQLTQTFALPAMRLFAKAGWISSLPLASGWTAYRDFPKPPRQTFLTTIRKGGRP